MDPQKTKDGQPYGPHRYKEIVRERYFITKNGGASYEDTGKMTPTERELYVGFIADEFARTKEAMDKAKEQAQMQKANRYSGSRSKK